MNAAFSTTLWIIGTSVSIEDGGYVTRLIAQAHERGWRTCNLSIGDQTSLMGCMRVFDAGERIAAGDIVVWEYSLLDTVLTEDLCVDAAETHLARRLAWERLLDRGARLIVVMTPPKRHLDARSICETVIAEDAHDLGLPVIDGREIFSALGIADPAPQYRDDRHPNHDSPLLPAMVARIFDAAVTWRPVDPHSARKWAARVISQRWEWIDAATLAAGDHLATTTLRNSLTSVESVSLPIEGRLSFEQPVRVIATGIVSTHDAGALWCGHPRCAPASARLPVELPYSFLLRASATPCLQAQTAQLVCAPDYIWQRGTWTDYGQTLNCSAAPVSIFGVLHENPMQ